MSSLGGPTFKKKLGGLSQKGVDSMLPLHRDRVDIEREKCTLKKDKESVRWVKQKSKHVNRRENPRYLLDRNYQSMKTTLLHFLQLHFVVGFYGVGLYKMKWHLIYFPFKKLEIQPSKKDVIFVAELAPLKTGFYKCD